MLLRGTHRPNFVLKRLMKPSRREMQTWTSLQPLKWGRGAESSGDATRETMVGIQELNCVQPEAEVVEESDDKVKLRGWKRVRLGNSVEAMKSVCKLQTFSELKRIWILMKDCENLCSFYTLREALNELLKQHPRRDQSVNHPISQWPNQHHTISQSPNKIRSTRSTGRTWDGKL